jgi:hypothetical protein
MNATETKTCSNARDAAAQLNEELAVAFRSAQSLCKDLRFIHGLVCKDNPSAADKLAERHVLELLSLAAEIKTKLEGLSE